MKKVYKGLLVAAGLWNMNICASRLGQKQRFVCSDD